MVMKLAKIFPKQYTKLSRKKIDDLQLFKSSRHYFNNIHESYVPFSLCIRVFCLILFFVLYLNKYMYLMLELITFFLISVVLHVLRWFAYLTLESTLLGRYTRKVRSALIFGFVLFLLSEIMLFAGFFWTFFDRIFHLAYVTFNMSQLNGFELIKWYKTPLIATIVLLTSGYILNYAYYLFRCRISESAYFVDATWVLAILFLAIQMQEYQELTFTIADSVYSSLFFLLTGFHGVHVMVGTVFITYASKDLYKRNFTDTKHIGFGIALIYWHFVDIIWIFLFLFIYMLNSWDFIYLVKKINLIAYLIY